ncbi:hypothetical protein D3C86_2227680 [compost metagenome]
MLIPLPQEERSAPISLSKSPAGSGILIEAMFLSAESRAISSGVKEKCVVPGLL